MSGKAVADWYFDFISPFSYFASLRIEDLRARLEIRYRPVLLAAILDHWGQKGPAEVPPKRAWTYRWCTWWATTHGVPFRLPAAHPFNPIAYLRLALAADCSPAAIDRIFERLWTTGDDPGEPAVVAGLAEELGLDVGSLQDPVIKQGLRRETNDASARGVFGVPTLVTGGHLFWGVEGLDLVRAYLNEPGFFESEEMRAAGCVPVGASRKISG